MAAPRSSRPPEPATVPATGTPAIPLADDAARRRGLRRMKAVATGLFVAVTVVFVIASIYEDAAGWIPFVRASAEAAMVGALADWFAVTALFRHPLGLPIPHTAIIPANKDRIGRSLGIFVQQHFLSPELVTERVRDAAVAQRVGAWLAVPANASRAADTLGLVIAGVADVLDDEEAASAVQEAVVARLRAVPAAPLAAKALEVGLENGHHQAFIDSVLRAAGSYLDDHREVLRDRLRVESPWWVPEPVDDRLFEKVVSGAKRFLADLSADPSHPLRRDIDRRLGELVDQLRTSPELADLMEQRKEELLVHPSVRAWSASLWSELKTWVSDSAREPGGEMRRRLEGAIVSLGERLQHDDTLQDTVDRWAADAATSLAAQYGDGVAQFMESTVARWDARETADRLEVQVGRDLQFIRLNGTIVGGLAGLVIFVVHGML
jgi:uncharacterized membrane-anchored protein YjiN (DUF445 family)